MSSIGSNKLYLLTAKPIHNKTNQSDLSYLLEKNNKSNSKTQILDNLDTKSKNSCSNVNFSYSFLENDSISNKFDLAIEAIDNFENKLNIMSSLLKKGINSVNDKSIIISNLNNLNKSRNEAIKSVEEAITVYNNEVKRCLNGNSESSKINSYKEKYNSFYSKFENLKVLDKNLVSNINKLLNQ